MINNLVVGFGLEPQSKEPVEKTSDEEITLVYDPYCCKCLKYLQTFFSGHLFSKKSEAQEFASSFAVEKKK